MKKLSLVAAAILITSHSLLAVPGFPLLERQIAKTLPRPAAATDAPSGCVDFSGNWKGKCSVAGASEDGSVEIKQTGCESVQIGPQAMRPGALEGKFENVPTAPGASYTAGYSMAYDWNRDHTQLETQFSGLVRAAGTQAVTPLNGHGTMKIEGATLVSDLEVLGFKVSCVYDKQ